jgi:TP901 family phage tail tape measure protein
MARKAKGITLPIIYKADLKGLKQAQSGLEKFGRVAGRIGLAAGAALAGVVVAGVKMAVDLETEFNKIEGLVGVTGDELDKLREAAKRLGPETGKSAQEAAEALFFITSAGLRGKDAIDVLEASLKGAAIGLGETKVIADLATSAMNAYGVENLSGAKAVDVLAEAVRLGKLAPEELAGSMGQVLPIASAMGVSFEEVGAVMAAMSRTGTNASQASTQLRGIMTSLLKPTAGAERALRDMGMTSDGLRQSIRDRGLLKTLEDLTEAFDGNDQGAEAVFGNVRALSGILDLFGENAEGTMEILKEMTDDLGVLDEAFALTEETVGFKTAKAFETFKSIMLEIGDAVLPLVVDILDDLLPLLVDAAAGVREFVDTKLGPFIDGLKRNEEFQNFLQIITDLIFSVVPEVLKFATRVGILAGSITSLLKPALEDIAGEDGILSSFSRILENVNFFLGEINTVNLPKFESGLLTLFPAARIILTPLDAFRIILKGIADALDAIRVAYEKLKQSGFMRSGFSVSMGSLTDPARSGSSQLRGNRAAGGSVMGGGAYLIGERGPEIFVPSGSGQIVPNHRLGGGSNITINVNAGLGTNGAEVGREIVAAIRVMSGLRGGCLLVPNTKVELGLSKAFTLDDPVAGVIGSTEFVLSGVEFVEVTDRVRALSIARGKNRDFDRFDAGSLSVELNNFDRAFDPLFVSSPFAGNIVPRRRVRVSVDDVPQYVGTINDWNIAFEQGGVSVASASAADEFTLLALEDVVPGTATPQTTGARVEAVLDMDSVRWPEDRRQVDAGVSVLGADVFEGNALEYLQKVELSEQGLLFIAKNGDLVFQDRLATPTVDDVTVFADDGSGIPFQTAELDYGIELLFNRIEVTSPSGTAVSDSLLSQTRYGIIQQGFDTLLEGSTQLQDFADFVASRYAEPELRFASLRVAVDTLDTVDRATVLGLEIGDVAEVKLTPNGIAPQVQRFQLVIGVSHEITPEAHFMNVVFGDLQTSLFVIGDPEFGTIGEGAPGVLGF